MLKVSFIMICIMHNFLVLLKINRNFKTLLKDFYFILKKNIYLFSQHIMMKRSKLEENNNIKENLFKDVRNLFRLKKLKKKKQMMPQLKVSEIFLD